MRIVRYIEDAEDRLQQPTWGLLLGGIVYPLHRAPYESPRLMGEFAPEIAGPPMALQDVKLVAPVDPRKVVCVGRNYAEHASELGNQVPDEPIIFLKATTSLIGPDEAVIYPSISQRIDHEGELAVVIGKRCRYLNQADASSVIFGYTIANDVTARDLQRKDGQWTRGKSFDTFGPVGPWVDTEFDPTNKRLRCLVNDEMRQDSDTSLMVYSVGYILAYISQFMTLEPGDLILTGTPGGVAPVQPGDVMKVTIEGLGTLCNPVIAGV